MVEAALIKGFAERRGREVWQFGGLGVKRSGHFPAKTSFRIKVPTSRKGREKWGTRRFRPAAELCSARPGLRTRTHRNNSPHARSDGNEMCKLVTWR